jgi:hypothetical protein
MTWWQRLLLVLLGIPWAYMIVNRISDGRRLWTAPRNWLLGPPRFWLGIPYTLYLRHQLRRELGEGWRGYQMRPATEAEEEHYGRTSSSAAHWTPTPRDSATRARRREVKQARRRNWYQ